jgi:NAD(P)H-hydrate epimerase
VNPSPQQRYGSITAAESARLDAAAIHLGVQMAQLMEIAGFQVARCAWRMLGHRPGAVHIVAGRGHNGGDGLVAARHLGAWGCHVSASVLGELDGLDALMLAQLSAAEGAGVAVRLSTQAGEVLEAAPKARLVVDALLGTGLRQPPRDVHAQVITGLSGTILSIDVPSGLDATSGDAPGAVVRATTTCTLAAVKRGMWQRAAWAHIGELLVADIGLPLRAWEACQLPPPTAVRAGRIVRVLLTA